MSKVYKVLSQKQKDKQFKTLGKESWMKDMQELSALYEQLFCKSKVIPKSKKTRLRRKTVLEI